MHLGQFFFSNTIHRRTKLLLDKTITYYNPIVTPCEPTKQMTLQTSPLHCLIARLSVCYISHKALEAVT